MVVWLVGLMGLNSYLFPLAGHSNGQAIYAIYFIVNLQQSHQASTKLSVKDARLNNDQ